MNLEELYELDWVAIPMRSKRRGDETEIELIPIVKIRDELSHESFYWSRKNRNPICVPTPAHK